MTSIEALMIHILVEKPGLGRTSQGLAMGDRTHIKGGRRADGRGRDSRGIEQLAIVRN